MRCVLLVAAPDHVAVGGVELDGEAAAAEPFTGDQGRAGAGERVEDDVAAAAAVLQHRLNQSDRLHRRMELAAEGPIDVEDSRLRVVAVPLATGVATPSGPAWAGLPGVEDVL